MVYTAAELSETGPMLEHKDFMMRLIRDLVEVLSGMKKKAIDVEDERDEALGGDLTRFTALFGEITGVSPVFLTPQTIAMVPDMLRLSSDPSRVVLAARLLIGRGQAGPDGAPFIAAARRLLREQPGKALEPEVEQVRQEALALLGGKS